MNNVPAHRLPPELLGALPFYVPAQGGGLWMAGGKFSFGSGGDFDSPIDPLLPVSMELRTEHRKLPTAMAAVLDRSGSMAAPVTGATRKMDLADEGAARCVELLSPADAVTVFAVDTQSHEIVPLTRVEGQQGAIGGLTSAVPFRPCEKGTMIRSGARRVRRGTGRTPGNCPSG